MTAEAELAVQVRKDFGDRYADVQAWFVPPSDRYPEGVKYSMQYGETSGETIFRYDNFPDHPGTARHHVHEGDDVRSIDFEDLDALYERFKREVIRRGHDW